MSGRKSDKALKSKNMDSPVDDELVLKTKPDNARVNFAISDHNRRLKVEMHTINLRKESVKMLIDAAKESRGPNFKFGDPTSYRDDGKSLGDEYWVDRGHLVVQEGIDYSVKDNRNFFSDSENIRKVIALERYGFHSPHCLEALKITGGDVGIALDILLSRYFGREVKFLSPESSDEDSELREEMELRRQEEIDSMQSIYQDFNVRIKERVWELPLDLDYFEQFYQSKVTFVHEELEDWGDEPSEQVKPPELCKFFLKGQCKFSTNCKFSHQTSTAASSQVGQKKEKEKSFLLQFRFPQGSLYPAEPALVCLSTTSTFIPIDSCLRVTERLMEEACVCATNDDPCVFSVVHLLVQQSDIITPLLLNKTNTFINPNESLMSTLDEHPKAGATHVLTQPRVQRVEFRRQVRSQPTLEDLLREDVKLERQFRERSKCDKKYHRFLKARHLLPAWKMKDGILHTIKENQVVVISGDTGCGKSTQIPQFILDEWLESCGPSRGRHVEIVCTQPRQLSAIGVAGRVADERSEKIGSSVGYQIRLDSKMSAMTRLQFCTIGILLRRMENEPTLTSLTHILVDEAHERSEESDILLLILKEILPLRPDLRVVIMSATLNPKLFSNYFNAAPTIFIEGRTFPVEQLFLEDAFERTAYTLDSAYSTYRRPQKKRYRLFQDETIDESELAQEGGQNSIVIQNLAILDEDLSLEQMKYRYQEYSITTINTLYEIDPEKINYDLVKHIILWIINGNHDYPPDGSILVFLPGIGEITFLHELLNYDNDLSPHFGKLMLLPLHSTLSSEEQAAVFQESKPGVRKIVLSTNIAETSITIADCVYVIDCGKMREKRFDSNKNMESLETVWISRANAKQRMGRAGRIKAGVCFHLFTKHRFRYQFIEQPVPELLRVPLEQQVLRVMTLPIISDHEPHLVLAKTLEPPPTINVTLALNRLVGLGAMESDYKLTPLGVHLAALPVDVRIGKIMILGACLGCVDSALTIAACLSYKSPFLAPFGKREIADGKRRRFTVNNSDQLTILKAYKNWHKLFSVSKDSAYTFAKSNYLSVRTLEMLADIKHQFLELLTSIGFVPAYCGPRRQGTDLVEHWTGDELNFNQDNSKLLAAILCAALYPNLVKVLTPEKTYISGSQGAIARVPKQSDLRFRALDGSYVSVHPSSVNMSVTHYSSPYLVYQEKVRTSKVFIRDCSMVPLIALVLFSGCSLKILLEQGDWVLALDEGDTKVHVLKHEHAELLQMIRSEFMKVLGEKINNPSLNVMTDSSKKVINTVVYLISNE